jgi:hypothetical protein
LRHPPDKITDGFILVVSIPLRGRMPLRQEPGWINRQPLLVSIPLPRRVRLRHVIRAERSQIDYMLNPAPRACASAAAAFSLDDRRPQGFNPAPRACTSATGSVLRHQGGQHRFQARSACACRCDTQSPNQEVWPCEFQSRSAGVRPCEPSNPFEGPHWSQFDSRSVGVSPATGYRSSTTGCSGATSQSRSAEPCDLFGLSRRGKMVQSRSAGVYPCDSTRRGVDRQSTSFNPARRAWTPAATPRARSRAAVSAASVPLGSGVYCYDFSRVTGMWSPHRFQSGWAGVHPATRRTSSTCEPHPASFNPGRRAPKPLRPPAGSARHPLPSVRFDPAGRAYAPSESTARTPW